MKYISIWMVGCMLLSLGAKAQQVVKLDLQRTIEIANDSSLSAFRYQNLYLSGYWEYRTYKANRLPSLTLDLTPAKYYRYITQRYDSNEDMDVYREQQMFSASGGLSIKQNLDWTGGTFYIDSELDFMRNFGDSKSTQYSSIPVRVGYQQSLLGYNAFRWDRKIEPLKYEKVKKQFIYNTEMVSEEAVTYFFALAMAQADYRLAEENVASSDTLYSIGLQRHKIAAISRADLLTLQLDKVNAHNTLQNAQIALKRAMFSLASFLNLDKNTVIELDIPGRPTGKMIPVDDALMRAKENNPTFLEQRQNVLEAEQNVDKTKKESRFNASFNASVGFNQVADKLGDAYRHPLQQDLVSVSVSIPLIDWGVRKGKYNMARNNLNVVRIAARQEELSVEEEVIMTVNDFNIQQSLIASAEEALDLAVMAYEQTRQRFIIGKADVNSLTLSLNRQQEAQKNYIPLIHPIMGMEEPWFYRNKAQFPIGTDKNGKIVTGFFAARTHNIISSRKCFLGTEFNEKILECVISFMEEYEVPAYREETGTGLVRHVLIRSGFATGEIMVCLVINGKHLPFAERLVEKLQAVEGMTSITLNRNEKNTNVILGQEIVTLWGQDYITDCMGEIKYQISPLSFYQVNPVQTRKLYETALQYAGLTGRETVWDLYCGIGTISLFLARKAKQVYGVEIVRQAIEDARRNAAINHIENAEFIAGRAEEVLPEFYNTRLQQGLEWHPDVIVVDPPRKGCDEKCLETIVRMQPQRVVYVSCDSATLARDLKYLCGGGYEVREVQMVDMFPHTVHVETVVLIQRKDT